MLDEGGRSAIYHARHLKQQKGREFSLSRTKRGHLGKQLQPWLDWLMRNPCLLLSGQSGGCRR